ncbi:MAG: AMP phosphorylase [Candidatus Micrarchaeota archaeon]|nr:AMP phosphorylase [Candidatus Micrarchaeota archaeon]
MQFTHAKPYLCKVQCFDMESGKNIVVLNENDAKTEDIYLSDRVEVRHGRKSVTCIVDVSDAMVKKGEVGVFSDVSRQLGLKCNDQVEILHVQRPVSLDYIKKKMDGFALTGGEYKTIVKETMANSLSEIELASFLTAMYVRDLTTEETVSLTDAMVSSGSVLKLGKHPVVDKHCSGGVAGNRTTMVMVPIIAAAGLYMPKTSSRAITSASGTADTMEVLADVTFSIDEMRDIVLKNHGCIVWGGAVNLAAVDDKFIRIRHPLRLDPQGVLLASILAKKKSVGAEYVIIDIPVGRGAKFENMADAKNIANDFISVGSRLGMKLECLISDGSDPIGMGIGPALECYDVLKVLENDGPADLKDKSCQLAGALLEICGKVQKGRGFAVASELLASGKAMKAMRKIIEAQGGDPKVKPDDMPIGKYRYSVIAEADSKIQHVDNSLISNIGRSAGAPRDRGAGVILHCEYGDKVKKGDKLFEIVAENESKLDFAIKALERWNPIQMQNVIIGKVK